MFGVCVLFFCILSILFETLFLALLGATPGKYFFKIRVVSLRGRLHFSQALLRTFIWHMELFLLFPYLEIFSDSMRRPLHDRAAGTMAITLKSQGDQGPQGMESHFVRQFLLITSMSLLAWVIFFGGQLYHWAIRGEFKKSELETSDFLCASVTSAVKSEDNRLDKALALFLADEISEECLAAEADFVLWVPDESEKSWAYLAKGIVHKFDSDQYEAYLDKTCQTEEEGEACKIAQHEANPGEFPLPKESSTASILEVTETFEKGHYIEAEKQFQALSKLEGFETFSQSGMVKSLWAQNKIERARGAYQNVVDHMPKSQNLELSAWICHEELDRSCSQEAVEACENLKEAMREKKGQIKESFVALALIREKECRQSNQFRYSQFTTLFEERKDLWKFTHAIAKDTLVGQDERSRILEDLAFRKESVRPAFIRRMALQQWVEKFMKSETDFLKIAQFLKEKKVKDLSWVKVYSKALQTFVKSRSQKAIKEIIDLPTGEMIASFYLHVPQLQAHYLLQNYDRAQVLLQSLQAPGSRTPASLVGAEDLSVERIRQELEKSRRSAQ